MKRWSLGSSVASAAGVGAVLGSAATASAQTSPAVTVTTLAERTAPGALMLPATGGAPGAAIPHLGGGGAVLAGIAALAARRGR